ncbi:hypothetical protein AZE42_02425 [Rhizopogon vesiculosus]|uniref:Uncharacterized protein n=1 Tax=Rhizopogon vesiculosus TaxID=180088 RepID=A0A1J8QTR3_9AGAM|nr:hypothetical protein AZE42_02425 [Rhizopogon vesiculosus]
MSTSRTPAALEVRPHVDDDEHGQSLSVRFDDQCILIPELPNRHRLPKMVAKSYSLPLWKRRSSSLGGSPSLETDAFVPEDSHFTSERRDLEQFLQQGAISNACSSFGP